MKCKIPQFLGLLLTLCCAFPAFVLPAWSDNPKPVCSADGAQSNPVAVSHPSSGAIFAWQDERNSNSDIYVQRLCGECDTLTMDWTSNGVPICTATGDQKRPVIICDSSGNTITAWEDKRDGNYDIYVQKVNAWGVVQWAVDGVALCVSPHDQQNPAIVGDSAGGAIVTWEDKRNGTDLPDIYAQRITTDGDVMWGLNGVAVCVQTADQSNPQVICNVMGGAIITWQDKRSGDYDIYAQRIDTAGTPLFAENGVVISSAEADQMKPRMVGDRKSGAIIVWQDFRSTIDYNIFTQRIGADGEVKWAADGLVMNNNMSGDQLNPVIVTDESGGAIIAWEDKRGADFDIYGQQVNSSGDVGWASTGVSICTATGDQLDPQIVGVYSGGAIITWTDKRTAASDIYLQRIASDGHLNSIPDGMAVCTADSIQNNPVIISDGNDGAIVAWQDFRDNNSDIYTQIIPNGSIGIRWRASKPSAMSRKGILHIDHSGMIHYKVETTSQVSLEILDLSGHLLATLVNGLQNPGSYSIAISGNHGSGRIPFGVYLCRFANKNSESVQRFSIMR